jgi:hypothetical protein
MAFVVCASRTAAIAAAAAPAGRGMLIFVLVKALGVGRLGKRKFRATPEARSKNIVNTFIISTLGQVDAHYDSLEHCFV